MQWLTQEKMELLIQNCRAIWEQVAMSLRDFARLIGRMATIILAIPQAPLWYQNILSLKNQTLWRPWSYKTTVSLCQGALAELFWRITTTVSWNERKILSQDLDLMMALDASLLGWVHFAKAFIQEVLVSCRETGTHQWSQIDIHNVYNEGLQQYFIYIDCMGDLLPSTEQSGYPTLDVVPGEGNNAISQMLAMSGQ